MLEECNIMSNVFKAIDTRDILEVLLLLPSQYRKTRSEGNILICLVNAGLSSCIGPAISLGLDPDSLSPERKPAIHIAAENGDTETLKALISAGANIDLVSKVSRTPLMIAAWERHGECVKLLLNAGANVDILDWNNWSALDHAIDSGNIDVVRYLGNKITKYHPESFINRYTSLHHAVNIGSDPGILEFLLEKGSDINSRDVWGKTPLLRAIEKKFVNGALCLLSKGANPNEPDNENEYAIHVATRFALSTVIEKLLHCGADINVLNNRRCSPLHYAALHGSCEDVKRLIQAGAEVDAYCDMHNTPLIWAVQAGKVEMANYLISMGADVNHKNLSKDSALTYIHRKNLPIKLS